MKKLLDKILRCLQGTSPRESSAFLDLPDDPNFVSEAPNIPWEANIKLCEEMLSTWNRDRFKSGNRLAEWKEEFYL